MAGRRFAVIIDVGGILNRLLLICPWFGKWPAWINFFIESCKHNPDVEWLIPTDQQSPENTSSNVKFNHLSFADFRERISTCVGVDLRRISPYKLCDLRPFYGLIFASEIEDYQSFGYCDLDVIWGDLLGTYTRELLDRYDAISSHSDRMAGHLAVFRNSAKMRALGTQIKGWRQLISDERHFGLDEGALTKLLRPRRKHIFRRLMAPKALFCERYSTPGVEAIAWPDGSSGAEEWYWKEGKLTNGVFPGGLPYLHFMLWQSNRWRRPHMGPAPWPLLDDVVQCDWRDAAKKGFSISPRGIQEINGLGSVVGAAPERISAM